MTTPPRGTIKRIKINAASAASAVLIVDRVMAESGQSGRALRARPAPSAEHDNEVAAYTTEQDRSTFIVTVMVGDSILDGYGLGGPKGCIIDLEIPDLRAAAIANGLVWSGPMAAQKAAVLDIASGRVLRPDNLPEWVKGMLALYAD